MWNIEKHLFFYPRVKQAALWFYSNMLKKNWSVIAFFLTEHMEIIISGTLASNSIAFILFALLTSTEDAWIAHLFDN